MKTSPTLAESKDLDLHLAVISATRAEKVITDRMSAGDIAEICGVSAQAIYWIENKALKKLRAACRRADITIEDLHLISAQQNK